MSRDVQIAQYGIYFTHKSLDFSASADAAVFGQGGVSVKRREFGIRAMAYSPRQELRSDKTSYLRDAIGISIDISSSVNQGNLGFSLGAVVAQATANSATNTYTCAVVGGGKQILLKVTSALPDQGVFDRKALKSMQEVISKHFPDAIDAWTKEAEASVGQPSVSVSHAGSVALTPNTKGGKIPLAEVSVPVPTYPEYSRLILFAYERAAAGLSYSDTYEKARTKFSNGFDPRPIAHVYISLGNGIIQNGPDTATTQAANSWRDELDVLVREYESQRESNQ